MGANFIDEFCKNFFLFILSPKICLDFEIRSLKSGFNVQN